MKIFLDCFEVFTCPAAWRGAPMIDWPTRDVDWRIRFQRRSITARGSPGRRWRRGWCPCGPWSTRCLASALLFAQLLRVLRTPGPLRRPPRHLVGVSTDLSEEVDSLGTSTALNPLRFTGAGGCGASGDDRADPCAGCGVLGFGPTCETLELGPGGLKLDDPSMAVPTTRGRGARPCRQARLP